MSEQTESTGSSPEAGTEAMEFVEPTEPSSSAETENTGEAQDLAPKTKKRIEDLIHQRNEERDRNKDLERRLAALEARPASSAPAEKTELPEPPAGLNQREIIDWYISEGFERNFEKRMGMDVNTAKTLLSSVPKATQSAATQQWNEVCRKHKLDPSDQFVQATVMGLVQGNGLDLDKALELTAGRLGNQSNGKDPVATVPDNTQSGATGRVTRIPKNREDAVAMAVKGETAPMISTLEYFAQKKKAK
jgi:hypothetical protein